jgi:ribulose bisphosphate carboxylase small subunit
MQLSRNEITSVAVIFILYSSFITAFLGIRNANKPETITQYEQGKRIGARAVKEYLIESKQIKAPMTMNYIRIKSIEDSLELNLKP